MIGSHTLCRNLRPRHIEPDSSYIDRTVPRQRHQPVVVGICDLVYLLVVAVDGDPCFLEKGGALIRHGGEAA